MRSKTLRIWYYVLIVAAFLAVDEAEFTFAGWMIIAVFITGGILIHRLIKLEDYLENKYIEWMDSKENKVA